MVALTIFSAAVLAFPGASVLAPYASPHMTASRDTVLQARMEPAPVLAARKPPASRANTWPPDEVAQLRGQCEASSIDQGLDTPRAHVLCDCAIHRLTQIFSRSWFNDGQPITPDELRTVSNVYLTCARRMAARQQRGASSI